MKSILNQGKHAFSIQLYYACVLCLYHEAMWLLYVVLSVYPRRSRSIFLRFTCTLSLIAVRAFVCFFLFLFLKCILEIALHQKQQCYQIKSMSVYACSASLMDIVHPCCTFCSIYSIRNFDLVWIFLLLFIAEQMAAITTFTQINANICSYTSTCKSLWTDLANSPNWLGEFPFYFASHFFLFSSHIPREKNIVHA